MSIAILLGPLSSILTIPAGFLADKNKSANKVLLYCVTPATIFLSFLLFADTVVTLILGYGAYALFNVMLIPLSDSLDITHRLFSSELFTTHPLSAALPSDVYAGTFGSMMTNQEFINALFLLKQI
ncbi:hypothetical protein P9112_003411 [Eukaryota sp. TZLM1-RC]